MNFYKVTLLILVFLNTPTFAQKLTPQARELEANHTITSKIMERDYQLYMSFPANYTTKDRVSYPVLYVLDGKYMFSIIDGTRMNLDFGGRIEEVIIVGIGSGVDAAAWQANRTYEFTPSQDTTVKRFASGGAEKFLKCITTEIIPFVDKHYKTNGDNGIMGHSLAGLFVTYCFLNATDSFSRYGMSSPSLMWKENEILEQATKLLAKDKTWDIPPTKAFISVGGEEERDMVAGVIQLKTLLKEKNHGQLTFSWKSFEEETHMSVIATMVNRTLCTLYGKK